MGAVFRIPVITRNCADSLVRLRELGYDVVGMTLDSRSLELGEFGICPKTCFVIGNEGQGIPTDVSALCDASVYVPISPVSESLNAAVAASLFLWEQSKAGN